MLRTSYKHSYYFDIENVLLIKVILKTEHVCRVIKRYTISLCYISEIEVQKFAAQTLLFSGQKSRNLNTNDSDTLFRFYLIHQTCHGKIKYN